ncbi:retropepsin-like aspartic protease [Kordia jejudonensis]|uniref:retropepsin-like aspartic protease n=1 Tax=Kordia jejudonensis TaxID=1348245 RepID=UPI00138DE568|nr:aspartyl protease family protein [Kordia jejudonensis]
MITLKKHTVLLILCIASFAQAQYKFEMPEGKDKVTVPFKLLNNLILIPVEVNGVEMSFLLDSGVNKPILFNLNPGDSLEIEQRERIELRGLGSGSTITAVRARSNSFKIAEVEKKDLEMFIILDEEINMSTRLGVPVHGIIGYDVFNDFIVEINYSNSKIKLHRPEKYTYASCRKCEDLPLTFRNSKPYIDVNVMIENGEEIPVKLLIDSGGSDALWLFEDEGININVPDKNFEDFLGKGLSGSIYGKRSRVKEFSMGKFSFKNAKVAFPDSTAIVYVKNFKERNGSIGGEILKRFKVVFDYGNKRIRLRKSRFYSAPFRYNMSGIELQHNGMRLVTETVKRTSTEANNGVLRDPGATGEVSIVYEHYNKFSLVKSFEVAEVREDSPAGLSGLLKGDVIISINGRFVHNYSLTRVTGMLEGKEGKKIRMKVNRNDVLLDFEFRLKEVL